MQTALCRSIAKIQRAALKTVASRCSPEIPQTGIPATPKNQLLPHSIRKTPTRGLPNLIMRNSASGNTTNYSFAANNRYGDAQDDTATGTAAVSGNSATGVLGSPSPWANFAY
jgi:hypothetical protein